MIELAQVSFSAFSDQSVGPKVVDKFLDDSAIGFDVVCILIALVSCSDVQVAAVDNESFLCGGRFGPNFASFLGVYIIHSLPKVPFSFGFGGEAFSPELEAFVLSLVTVKRLAGRAGVLIEILHCNFVAGLRLRFEGV